MRSHRAFALFGMTFAALLFTMTSPARAADDTGWKAGVSSVRITPDRPVMLAGYAARTRPFDKVDLDLYARALAIEDADKNRAVLIALDLCILPPDVADGIRQRITEKTRIDAAGIVLSLSHTHSGPAVSLQTEGNGVNAGSEDTARYTRELQDRIAEAAERAVASMAPAKLSWGSGVTHFAVNRRQFTEKGVILGVNPRGPTDRSVPVLRVDGADGKPRAILFGYACHGTTLGPAQMNIHPDFPGYARAAIEEHFPGATALFMTGCGGDANPYPRGSVKEAMAHGQALGTEVCRVADGKLAPISGKLACVRAVAPLPLEVHDRPSLEKIAETGAGLRKADAKQMLATLDRGEKLPETNAAPLTVWQFGNELTMVALPNEVVVDYVTLLEGAVGPLKLWVAAYCHEVAGYIPSRRVLKEGGYETRGLYVGTGWFAPEAEDVLVRTVAEAASKAGRAMPGR